MEEVAGLVWDGTRKITQGLTPVLLSDHPAYPSSSLLCLATMCHTLGSPGSGLSLLLFLLGLCRKTLYPELLPPSADNSDSLSCQRALCSQLGPVFRASQHPLGLPSSLILSYLPALLLCFSVAQISLSRMQSSLQSRLFQSLQSHSGHLLSSQSTWIFRF